MAHGFWLVTGRPQAVMLHVNVGTANAICGLINAARESIPMLVAAGRKTTTDGLDLEKGGIAYDRRGITVDQRQRSTSNKRVYAVGDVGGNPQFTHMAGYGGGLDAWLRHWRGLWPDDSKGRDALEQLVSLADRLGIRRGENDAEDWRNSLERRAVSLLRRRRDEPVTVFCHLLLSALELHRLRQGLLERALFNDLEAEVAA